MLDAIRREKALLNRLHLLDLLLKESNPTLWESEEHARSRASEALADGSKEGKVLASMIMDGWRKEIDWRKKNASATAHLMAALDKLLLEEQAGLGKSQPVDRRKEIAALEKEAKKRLARTRPTLPARMN